MAKLQMKKPEVAHKMTFVERKKQGTNFRFFFYTDHRNLWCPELTTKATIIASTYVI